MVRRPSGALVSSSCGSQDYFSLIWCRKQSIVVYVFRFPPWSPSKLWSSFVVLHCVVFLFVSTFRRSELLPSSKGKLVPVDAELIGWKKVYRLCTMF